MLKAVYTRTLAILKKVPVKLWGLSLLSQLIPKMSKAIFVTPLLIILLLMTPLFAASLLVIPQPIIILIMLISLVTTLMPTVLNILVKYPIETGMATIYYKNYTEGVTPDSKPLFAAFKDFQTFKHVAGGMSWKALWLFLWFLIPIAGPIIAIYKAIQYTFTPYILLEEPSVRALDAIKKSKEYTNGYKGQIFLGIVLPCIAYFFVVLILTLLGMIPYVGIVFIVICAIVEIIFALFAPLFFGLVGAGFYEYCRRPVKPLYSAPVAPAPVAPVAPAAPTAPVTPAPAAPVQTAAPVAPAQTAAPVAPAETVTAAPSVVFCPTCGSQNGADKKFCSHCGAKLQ